MAVGRLMAVGAARGGREAAAGRQPPAAAAGGAATRHPLPGAALGAAGVRAVVGAGTPGFVGGLDAVLGYSFRDRLPEIEVPTLIVWGRNDILIPVEDAYEFQRLIGENARLEVFDDTGHLAMLERPSRFNELLADFIAARTRPGRRAGVRRAARRRDRALRGAADLGRVLRQDAARHVGAGGS